jgi:hypothetical protein
MALRPSNDALPTVPGDNGGWWPVRRRAGGWSAAPLLGERHGTPRQKSGTTEEGTGFSISILAGSEVVAYSPKPARAPMVIRPPRSTGRRAPLLLRAPTPVAGARVVSSSTCSSFDAPLCRPSARETQETERTRWSCCGAAEVELGADG